jgi:hypothetical protein
MNGDYHIVVQWSSVSTTLPGPPGSSCDSDDKNHWITEMPWLHIRDYPNIYQEVMIDSQIGSGANRGLFMHVMLQLHGLEADEPRDATWGDNGDNKTFQRIMHDLYGISVLVPPQRPWGEFYIDRASLTMLLLKSA